jgi:acyl-coenzyme A synthetase/AMP-(fatty) acid ligase
MLALLPEDKPAFPTLAHLRLIGVTPPPALVEAVRRKVSPHVYIPYSTSEVGVVAMATPDIVVAAPGSSGRVVPGARLEVIDADGRPVAPGVAGEVRVAVDGMPAGYLGEAEDSKAFRDGWFYPRDRGRVSAQGLLYIEGRSDEILNVGGRKVAPATLEAMLAEQPGVREAAVFALDEGPGGIRLGAAIVPGPALDWRSLAAFAQAHLDVLAPHRYFGVPSLPRNDAGKVVRRDLAAWVRAHGEVVA